MTHMTSEDTFYRFDKELLDNHEFQVVDSGGKVIKHCKLPDGARFEIPSYKGLDKRESARLDSAE